MRVLIAGLHPYSEDRIGGGVQAVTHYLAQALAADSAVEVEVVTLNFADDARTARLGPVTVHYVPRPRAAKGPLSEWATARVLARKIRQCCPDIVNAHVAGLFARAAHLSGLPWVLTPHGVQSIEIRLHPGTGRHSLRYWRAQRIEQQNTRRARFVISNSQFVRRFLEPHLRGRVYDIDNPVADKFFDVPDRSRLNRFLVVGKLIYRKGIHVLLAALPAVLKQHPDVEVRFAGSTAAGKEPQAYWADIQRQVADLGLANAVSFLGELDEAALLEEYASCGTVVSSSSMEASAMGILEAMAAGRPIVGTRVGGTPWLLENERNGLLVEPDDPAGLATAMNRLLSSESAWKRMGQQSKLMAEERCRASAVAARTIPVFREVIESWNGN